MCLILFAYCAHPRYRLVVAANRDEFYARPTVPAGFWDEAPDLLAGRDLEAGGTWLGISRRGRFAAITNYRDPSSLRHGAPSRGRLVSDFLQGRTPPAEFMSALARRGGEYNGFNLLLADIRSLWYFSNRGGPPRALAPGLYGLSNHLLDSPWPKVERGRRALASLLDGDAEPSPAALLALLEDRVRAADEDLPDTGVGLARERVLSSMYIESPEYGTRCSTALLVQESGAAVLLEKTREDGEMREFELSWPIAHDGAASL